MGVGQDELLWAAAWLYKASMDPGYLQYVRNNSNLSYTVNEFSWDNKNAATQVLLSKVYMMLFEYLLELGGLMHLDRLGTSLKFRYCLAVFY